MKTRFTNLVILACLLVQVTAPSFGASGPDRSEPIAGTCHFVFLSLYDRFPISKKKAQQLTQDLRRRFEDNANPYGSILDQATIVDRIQQLPRVGWTRRHITRWFSPLKKRDIFEVLRLVIESPESLTTKLFVEDTRSLSINEQRALLLLLQKKWWFQASVTETKRIGRLVTSLTSVTRLIKWLKRNRTQHVVGVPLEQITASLEQPSRFRQLISDLKHVWSQKKAKPKMNRLGRRILFRLSETQTLIDLITTLQDLHVSEKKPFMQALTIRLEELKMIRLALHNETPNLELMPANRAMLTKSYVEREITFIRTILRALNHVDKNWERSLANLTQEDRRVLATLFGGSGKRGRDLVISTGKSFAGLLLMVATVVAWVEGPLLFDEGQAQQAPPLFEQEIRAKPNPEIEVPVFDRDEWIAAEYEVVERLLANNQISPAAFVSWARLLETYSEDGLSYEDYIRERNELVSEEYKDKPLPAALEPIFDALKDQG